jgi:hypothetical protein
LGIPFALPGGQTFDAARLANLAFYDFPRHMELSLETKRQSSGAAPTG